MAAHPPYPAPAPPGAPDDPLDGTPYRTVARLGGGGMGEVFEAEHRGLRKRVVVKLLHRELAHDPRFADRMRVEAQALAAVSSPHVVAVSDLGRTPAGRAYLVMERLHGRTLREELELRGPLAVAEAVGITRQVLAGLEAAHRLGIVHRDVKLDNVFLCAPDEQGTRTVKILDFGIAKVLRPAAPAPALPAPRYATEEGMLVGSPRTVSPEQARFQKVDARTDVYAVGLLLYTLLAGEGPFSHDDVLALLNAHICEAPAPPSRVAAQPIPPELDRAILKALAKRPEHRFQSAARFAEALDRVAPAPPSGPRPPAPAPAGGATLPIDGPAQSAARTTAQGTLVIPASGPLGGWAAGGASSDLPAAWPAAHEAPLAELPANLAPATRAPGQVRLLVVLTLASTVLFSLIAALALRYVGGGE